MISLPPGWEHAELNELRGSEPNAITDGPYGSNLKSSHYSSQGARVVRLGNIGAGIFLDHDTAFVPLEHFERLKKHRVFAHDIVVAALGDPIGRACILPEMAEPAVVKADCFRFRTSPEISKKYVMLWLNSEQARQRFFARSHGLGRIRINLSDFRGTTMPVAPFPEQQRIVAKIDGLTGKSKRARDRLDHIPRLVEKYKEAMLAAAFHEAQTAAHVDTTLGEIATEVRNGLGKKPTESPGGTPILRISAVRPRQVRIADVRYYPSDDVPPTSMLRNGDLLFTRYNGNADYTAVCGQVRDAQQDLTYPDKLIRVRLRAEALASFVELMCTSPQARSWLIAHIKSAAGQHGISGADLKKLPVPLPSIAVQTSIIHRVESAFTWIDHLRGEATSARRLIDRLDQVVLAKAFGGELVLQDPADEPASVLLERIRAARSMAPKRGRRAKAGA
ncbi:restriction endonuclease subunit S [Mesorhizobium sp. M0571]|uniref:restriction endonuclease subunit S n=1 Tax=Mesorhizobium sp. M0571 TaxID=2956960 RepID=UPI003335447F